MMPSVSAPELLLDRAIAEYPLDGYRRNQVLAWVFGQAVADFSQMTNLPAATRQALTEQFVLDPYAAIQTQTSSDGSVKYLFTLRDGRQMEAVYMPYADRKTICVSTMVGCPAGCAFCATGRMGFGRNLTSGEILGQVLAVARGEGVPVAELRNVVFMGMGEPLLNYDQTLRAARIMLDDRALGLSGRRVTLSTVGLPRQIERLASEDIQLKLAISLHAPDEATRQAIIPTAHAHSIAAILASARRYQRATGRRVTFEYAMLAGVNDAPWQADLLADLLRGLVAHVNLIPMNPWPESGFVSSSEDTIDGFYGHLEWRGVPVSVRRSRGRDAGAACGQLALHQPQPQSPAQPGQSQ
jgi:23S rRNA (adenine2503-C2)-methyltransferase